MWFNTEQKYARNNLFPMNREYIDSLKSFAKTPCQCNRERKKCTPECSHVPNFRKECTPTCGESCKARRLPRRWKPAKVHVQKNDTSLDEGILICDDDAPPGRFLTVYSGVVTLKEDYDWEKEDYGRKLFMEFVGDFILDGKNYGSEARYARHSCSPNCDAELWYEKKNDVMCPVVVLVANRQIKKGDELTYAYNINCVDDLPKMKCDCGKPTCPDTPES